MKHTLSEVRTLVKQFVDSGSCRNEVIDARINEAVERLMDGEDWECLRRLMRVAVTNNTIVLPANVEKVMWVANDGVPGKIFGQPYQFMSSGVGDLTYRCTGSQFKDLMDLGDHWAVWYEVPETIENELSLIAFSPEAADDSLEITFSGRTRTHVPVSGTLEIKKTPTGVVFADSGDWDGDWGALSTEELTFVDKVAKPATTGRITLLAVDVTGGTYYRIAEYEPGTLLPQFRRYQITNKVGGTDVDMLALVKLRFTKLVNAVDEVLIDSIQAIKLMVMAIREENAGNLQAAINYEMQARRVLTDREKSRTMSDGTPVIINMDYRASLGRHINKGGILL